MTDISYSEYLRQYKGKRFAWGTSDSYVSLAVFDGEVRPYNGSMKDFLLIYELTEVYNEFIVLCSINHPHPARQSRRTVPVNLVVVSDLYEDMK